MEITLQPLLPPYQNCYLQQCANLCCWYIQFLCWERTNVFYFTHLGLVGHICEIQSRLPENSNILFYRSHGRQKPLNAWHTLNRQSIHVSIERELKIPQNPGPYSIQGISCDLLVLIQHKEHVWRCWDGSCVASNIEKIKEKTNVHHQV